MTINDTWGYKSYDTNFKSTETLLRNLIDIASKGGNFLLNVGPTSDGVIPQPEVDRLADIGKWMSTNGDAIYSTTASPIAKPTWGRLTRKADGSAIYLHVFDWPSDGTLRVAGLKDKFDSATLLADGTKLDITSDNTTEPNGLAIKLPTTAPDNVSSTIVLKVHHSD
jgi:alpha-L-fucosidase